MRLGVRIFYKILCLYFGLMTVLMWGMWALSLIERGSENLEKSVLSIPYLKSGLLGM